jgi:hypothetical protein
VRGMLDDEEAVVLRFLGGMRVAPVGRSEGEMAGRWRRNHARRGITPSQADHGSKDRAVRGSDLIAHCRVPRRYRAPDGSPSRRPPLMRPTPLASLKRGYGRPMQWPTRASTRFQGRAQIARDKAGDLREPN